MSEPLPPHRVFAPSQERKATVEVLIDVIPDPSARPAELEPLLDEVLDRLSELLGPVEAMTLTGRVAVDFIYVMPSRQIPYFPVRFGKKLLPDYVDLIAAITGLPAGNRCVGLLYDAAGRAFSCSVSLSFERREKDDRLPHVIPWN